MLFISLDSHPSIYLVSWSFEFWSVEKIRLFVCLYTFKRCICWWVYARFCSQFANYSFSSRLCCVLVYICALKIEWFWNEHFRHLLILNIESDAHFNFKMHIADGLRTIVIWDNSVGVCCMCLICSMRIIIYLREAIPIHAVILNRKTLPNGQISLK